MKKNITLKDIAQKVGVSAVTVSKALTDKEGVSDDVRKKIKEIASELGYKGSSSASSWGQSGNIGVIIAKRFIKEDENAFYLKMYQGLVQTLSRFRYYGILEIVDAKSEKEFVMPKLLEDKKVDGIIILGQFQSNYIKLIEKYNVPIVLLDFYDKNLNLDSVISDSVYGGYRAVNYLISKGHRKIGFVGSIFSTNSIMDRYLGYYKAMIEARCEVKPEWLIEDRNEEGEYIPLSLPEADKMPTAFLCNCDNISYILINKLSELGYSVPEDISVIGYDNSIRSVIPALNLTTVDVNIEAMTEAATDLIIKKIKEEKHCCGMRIVESKLIIRESVKEVR
ncbi:LacI family DNA-binding transcriptional regulator [[Clostridium] polysaccharolyticum]|uniref:Transcriptional regulator, LacI family n=1 Tax=[Clostridium] polysaccharolyticum TaxID=29364 RepID=A0A1I0F4K8_9FIRM|nr:LacI family DNA-binding transcriptional regulator [[Clostridium] polysaccharolyticum]SET52346.1 transcriptional regulator, LacI family [[Clostridium] polysaccharolyticum]